MSHASLPIDPLIPEIVAVLERDRALVLEAPPGAGKTTRVPAALIDAAFAGQGEIVVLQPRRLPARLAAARVAEERGERIGATIGYTVRFEDVGSARTRLRFVTEGILTRRLLADQTLRGVSTVVLDEFHERHLATDLALGLLRELQLTARPDLRLVVMSATLDGAPVAEYLGGAACLRSDGRRFDVAVEHAAQPDDRPLAVQVASAVRRLVQAPGGAAGDMLVFLPGAAEIRRAGEALESLARTHDLLVLPLHGELAPAEQDRAVRPAQRPKVILSTNVAETSVTIDGVVAVIDSGLARIASHSPWTGLPRLRVEKTSQASAIQRAGRAGRTRPGRAIRLYTRADFDGRRGYDAPEIERLDLSEALLSLAAAGIDQPGNWAWFERPPAAALGAAVELLRALGATDKAGALTETGRRMLRFPVHPRLARLLVESERRGVSDTAATVVALLSGRDVREDARTSFAPVGPGRAVPEDADLLALADAFDQVRSAGFQPGAARSFGIDGRAAKDAERTRRQLARMVRNDAAEPRTAGQVDAAVASCVLAAFPDRVGRRRADRSEIVMSGGGVASIGASPPSDLVVAVSAEERHAGGRTTGTTVRLAVGLDAEALLEAEGLTESDFLLWNDQTERVDRIVRLSYGAITLEESRRPAEPSEAASAVLASAVRARGAAAVVLERVAVERLRSRLAILHSALPEEAIPMLAGDALDAIVEAACADRTSFADLRSADALGEWFDQQPPRLRELLRAEAPERIRLPGGREVPVNYELDRPPWIESRLQDFFGMATGPRIARGRVPITLHLLAPNARAVQVTSDLASFWSQHYPSVRRELGRRYLRHSWPEDGATATPPAPSRRLR